MRDSRTGNEKKRLVIIALAGLVVLLGAWFFHDKSTPGPPPLPDRPTLTEAQHGQAQRRHRHQQQRLERYGPEARHHHPLMPSPDDNPYVHDMPDPADIRGETCWHVSWKDRLKEACLLRARKSTAWPSLLERSWDSLVNDGRARAERGDTRQAELVLAAALEKAQQQARQRNTGPFVDVKVAASELAMARLRYLEARPREAVAWCTWTGQKVEPALASDLAAIADYIRICAGTYPEATRIDPSAASPGDAVKLSVIAAVEANRPVPLIPDGPAACSRPFVGLCHTGPARYLARRQLPDDRQLRVLHHHCLAMAYAKAGAVAQARRCLDEALAVATASWHDRHIDRLVLQLDKVALLLREGDIAQAETILDRVGPVLQRLCLGHDLRLADTYALRADIARRRGRHARAIEFLLRAEAVWAVNLSDPMMPQVQDLRALSTRLTLRPSRIASVPLDEILLELGRCYTTVGQHRRAARAMHRRLATLDGHVIATLDKPHRIWRPARCALAEQMAEHYAAADMPREAIAWYRVARVYTRGTGFKGDRLARNMPLLKRLVELHRSLGDRASATEDQRELERLQTLLLDDDPGQALAQARLHMGVAIGRRRWAEALRIAEPMIPVVTESRAVYAGAGDPETWHQWSQAEAGFWHLLLTCAVQRADDPTAGRLALAASLNYKGIDTNLHTLRRRVAREIGSEALAGLLQSVGRDRQKLGRLLKKEPDPANPTRNTAQIQRLEHSIREAEARLAASTRDRLVRRMMHPVEPRDVLDRLPPDAALLSFHQLWDLAQARAGHYLLIVATRESPPRVIDLGPADCLENTVGRFKADCYEALARIKNLGTGRALEQLTCHAAAASDTLLARAWPIIGDKPRWFVSLDGYLHGLPMDVLVAPGTGRWLIEDIEIQYLESGRDLLQAAPWRAPRNVVLVAAPDYDARLDESDTRGHTLARTELRRVIDYRHFSPLPATRLEALKIEHRFKKDHIDTHTLTGKKASPAALLETRSPSILHVATHGFYAPSFRTALGHNPFFKVVRQERVDGRLQRILPLDPLLYHGLVMAGANNRNDPTAGLVTAYEISGMQLGGTRLVVLSACDTGRGKMTFGTGSIGMQQALLRAGAAAVVGSAWSVPDRETAELMVAFYDYYLKGNTASRALRLAKMHVRELATSDPTRAHPFYWAAFNIVGRPEMPAQD